MFNSKHELRLAKLATATFTLFGIHLILVGISTTPVLARDPVSVVCSGRITVAGNLKIPYCSNKPLEQPNATVRRAIIVVHGTGRNSDDYYQYIVDSAKKAGALNETIILAPQFLLEEDIKDRKPGNDVLFWTNDGWKQGDPSVSTSSNPRSASASSFGAVNLMMERLANRSTFPNLQSIVITGHSAGGQFTDRFVAGSQEVGIQTRYVVANPSSYLYFDGKRRVAGTLNQFAIPTAQERSNCSEYNQYKYGLERLNSYMQNVGVDRIQSQYSQRQVVYLLGEKDTDPNSDSLDKDCPAMLQGKHRFERGTIFYNYLQQYYGSAIQNRHLKVTVPGVAHDGRAMFNSNQGIQVLFGQASPSPTPTPSPSPTPTPTPTPIPNATSATLKATDGYDTKLKKTLSQDGKVYTITRSDNEWWEVEAGNFTAFKFQNTLPTNATIQSVKVYVEHHEEQDIGRNPLVWQVGGGSLNNPTISGSFTPPVLKGEASEKTVEWDVTQWINTPAKINDLKLVIRNNDTAGKKSRIDRVYVVVTYRTTPSKLTDS
jgi:hypothetical protein